MMKSVFIHLAKSYTANSKLIEQLWSEIETTYTHPKRHYHNLHHLEQMFRELSDVKEKLRDWDTALFSVFYHDVVYNPLRRDNEERSIVIVENRLRYIDVPEEKIADCKAQILCTQTHQHCADSDSNFFTDADLSILGQDWERYEAYAIAVRQEYALYADNLYYPGRKAVLHHFLQMNRIFKTQDFFDKYEKQARENLLHELRNIEQMNKEQKNDEGMAAM